MAANGGESWISMRMAIGLVIVSALSLVAFMALSAYAPDLRTETAGRANVLSKSAVGYAGLRVLLEETGATVTISREHGRQDGGHGLLVLTPDSWTSGQSVAALAAGPLPVLIILPKWYVAPDLLQSGWVQKTGSIAPAAAASVLAGLDSTVTVSQDGQNKGTNPRPALKSQKTASRQEKKAPRPKPVPIVLKGSAEFGGAPYPAPVMIESLQTVSGKAWQALLTDAKGRAVLARLQGTKIYVLSDPDLLNTAALKDAAVAEGAIALMRRLPGSRTTTFDVTLAGFDKPPSLLHALFAPPLLAVTLCALLAAGLMGARAVTRFGTPRREARSFAFGKRSLADNSASLIRVMGRGPSMAPRYAAAVRRIAAKALRGGRGADAAWLDGVERAGRISPAYHELLAESETVKTEAGLMALAARLHAWKSRITHERS